MKKPTTVIFFTLLALAISSQAQQDDTTKIKPEYREVNPYVDDNETCFACHGEIKYLLEDVEGGRTATKRMAPCKIVHRDKYYTSVHHSFACTDCHSYEFNTFPHSMDSRFEEKLLCMDCHGYDESFAQYHFEEIEIEFSESIHNIADFDCWSCHDPHSYKAFMRNSDDIAEAILYDNTMCMRCHADYDRFAQKTDREEIIIVESHDWLPNQVAHFNSVRCIECHTEINDTILIAHKILPKTEAVQKCTECHSRDSRLMHTLYKFNVKEGRKAGFANGIILNDAYVIGANRNIILNVISFLVFGLTFLVVVFHAVLRYIKLKNK